MIIPLDTLLREDGNIYEVTCAAIRRAYQITITGDEDIEKNQGKIVSLAIKQILTKTIQYRLAE